MSSKERAPHIPDGLAKRAGVAAQLAANPLTDGISVGVIVRHDDPTKLREHLRRTIENAFEVRVPIVKMNVNPPARDIEYTEDPRISMVVQRKQHIQERIGYIISDQQLFAIFVRLANDEKAKKPLVIRLADGNLKTIDETGNAIFIIDYLKRIFAKEIYIGTVPEEAAA